MTFRRKSYLSKAVPCPYPTLTQARCGLKVSIGAIILWNKSYNYANRIKDVLVISTNSIFDKMSCTVRANIPSGLPRSGKNIWKMKFFPGQGSFREFCGWPGKFRKDLESQGKVREFKNKLLWQAVLRKIYLFCLRGERIYAFS